MKRHSLWTKIFLGTLGFSILGLALVRFTQLDPGPIQPLASAILLVSGFLALAQLAHWTRTVAVLVLGVAAELLGLYTGVPFGAYEYTTHWQPTIVLPGGKVFPLLVPLGWFLITGGAAITLRPLRRQAWIVAPILATLIDFFMEPVMTEKLHYWRWVESGPLPGGAPWMNMLGWFITSMAATMILGSDKKQQTEGAVWILAGYVVLLATIWLMAPSSR